MNALSHRPEAPTKRQEALLRRLVRVLARLQDLARLSEDRAAGDHEFLQLSPEERSESKALVMAAGYPFRVPEGSFSSLLRREEASLLHQSLNNWDDLSFRQRALVKETLLLLFLLFSLVEPIKIDRRGSGDFIVREAVVVRKQLGL